MSRGPANPQGTVFHVTTASALAKALRENPGWTLHKWCSYWDTESIVVSVDGYWITERDPDGRIRKHCTTPDAKDAFWLFPTQ